MVFLEFALQLPQSFKKSQFILKFEKFVVRNILKKQKNVKLQSQNGKRSLS